MSAQILLDFNEVIAQGVSVIISTPPPEYEGEVVTPIAVLNLHDLTFTFDVLFGNGRLTLTAPYLRHNQIADNMHSAFRASSISYRIVF